jgi:hypothetical protein
VTNNVTSNQGGLFIGTFNGGNPPTAQTGLGFDISNTGTNLAGTWYDTGGNCTVGSRFSPGGVGCSSDARMKTNVSSIQSGLDQILKLRPVTFQMKSDGTYAPGFIAQEVEPILPLLVDIGRHQDNPAEFLYLNSSGMIPYMVKAIQELTARVAVLEGRR